ncbi:glycosyltransferase family 22 protein [Meredithblackwellia eburnea MCA 4105]
MQPAGVNVPSSQQMRFAKAAQTPEQAKKQLENRQKGIEEKRKLDLALLKDHNLKLVKPGWSPSFLVVFRLIILVRFFAGMYSNISDCDEVFNYWEPLHYLLRGVGFQTWEYSPVYAIRSYFYLVLNSLPTFLTRKFTDKRVTFFALRLTYATASSAVEAAFYRAAAVNLSPHVGRYLLWSMVFSAAFWTASTAFLPSTFAMWGSMLGQAVALSPVSVNYGRISLIGVAFATAAFVGWPFAALLAAPPVLEHLFIRGSEKFAEGKNALWAAKRARSLFVAGLAGASVLLPVIFIDSNAYQKFVIVPLNIIKYNILNSSGGGPELYGVEPPSYYLKNGLLAFNIMLPLALLSIPALILTLFVDPKRFGDLRDRHHSHTHPAVSVAIRLVPMYLWLAVLTVQPHKEERFLFPAYGHILLNAAVTLYLCRGWFEQAHLKFYKSPYAITQTKVFSHFTRAVIVFTSILSLMRIGALHSYYRAPLNMYFHLQYLELPRLALLTYPHLYTATPVDPTLPLSNFSEAIMNADFTIDTEPLAALNLRLCLGKEWHRFPSHFLVPDEVEVRFIESDFKGILPKLWDEAGAGKGLWGRSTGSVPSGMNDLNKEERDRYVDVSTCHYLIDLDFPHRPEAASPLEPRYAADEAHWDRLNCLPFLDNAHSPLLFRTLWLPVPAWERKNTYGDYCLLRQKAKF